MKLLAIDTATDACTVALEIDGEVREDHRVIPRLHAQQLLPMIDTLLQVADLGPRSLDGLIFGQGPGSFTGVRIAAACVQGVALGADLGVCGVSTLATMAQGCLREHGDALVHVALDARMEEIYWGLYATDDVGRMGCVLQDRALRPEAISAGESDPARAAAVPATPVLAGSGAERYADILRTRLGGQSMPIRTGCLPQARDLLTLGKARVAERGWQPAETAVPVYLRNRVALSEAERAAGQTLSMTR